jgi:hypothetical protein
MKESEYMKIIKKPKVYLIVGLGWIILWTPISIATCYNMIKDSFYIAIPALVAFVMQIFIGIFIFMYSFNFKIELNGDEVLVSNWLGKKTKYLKGELKITLKYVNSATHILWYNDKKIARISMFDDNCQELSQFKFKK